MSWLLNKAEDFLNKVDQTAAGALHRDEEGDQAGFKQHSSKVKPEALQPSGKTYYGKQDAQAALSYSVSVPANLSKLNTNGGAASGTTRRSSTVPKKKDKDDELFEFLNSEEPLDGNGRKSERPKPAFSHSRQSSTSSTVSNRSGKQTDAPQVVAATASTSGDNHGKTASVSMEDRDSVGSQPEIHDFNDDAHSIHNSSSSGRHSRGEETHAPQHQLSSLELENKLLRSEVSSLNQEMASVIERAKVAQADLQKTRATLVTYQQQISGSDQIVRELQAREADLLEAVRAKDSQLAVLRVRFEEGEKEIQLTKERIQALENDKSRILHDHTESTGVQSHALDSLKEKLHDAEKSLHREQEAYRKIQEESMQRHSQLESEQKGLTDALANVQRKLADEKSRNNELFAQIKTLKNNCDAAKHELSDYKQKAARILQGKDKLIASLKEGANAAAVGASPGSEASSITSTIELEELRQEKDMYREELAQCRMNIENLRLEVQDLESQIQTDNDNAQDMIRSLDDQLRNEKRKREEGDQDILKQKQELRFAHEELLKQKTNFATKIQEKEGEIEKIRLQLSSKNNGSTSQAELENRLHALTESLIQKQTMLEALGTEKNSLGLQLERLERQYMDIQSSAARASATHVHITDEDEARHRLPMFMRESPLDTKVARGMKKAANTLDKFGIKFGVFLRRYPMARIFVLLYMFVLHFWVIVVLMTYQPEIHGVDYHPQAPQAP